MAEESAESFFTAHSSLSRSARSATSAVMAAASARVAPSRRSAGFWPSCRSANLAALSACASLNSSSLCPLKSRAKASLTRAPRTSASKRLNRILRTMSWRACARRNAVVVMAASSAASASRSRAVYGAASLGDCAGARARASRVRANSSGVCATAAASCTSASNEADCDIRTSAASRSSWVTPSAAATSRGRRRAAAWAATLVEQVVWQRVNCVSGQQPHLPVSAVCNQDAHDGAVPALRRDT